VREYGGEGGGPQQASTPAVASEAKSKRAPRAQSKPASAKAKDSGTGMTERQTAVLKALRSLMDKKHRVEASRAELAKASSVPLGSLHSTLVSLEKKHLIKTERQGTPKFSPIYQVLETSAKSTRSLNGVLPGKAAQAQVAH
jgi:DNA-binding transcriptional ArsR family regulator